MDGHVARTHGTRDLPVSSENLTVRVHLHDQGL